VSTTARECPGAARCPRGGECFAERARAAAIDADVVVVNLHLYGLHLAAEGGLLPEHDIVIVDEAHQLEDVIAATAGVEISPGRFTNLSRVVKGIVADDALLSDLDGAADVLGDALRKLRNERISGAVPPDLVRALTVCRSRSERALSALRAVPDGTENVNARKARAQRAATAVVDDIDAIDARSSDRVLWVDGTDAAPVLRNAPVDVAGLLADQLWSERPAVLTSATIPPAFTRRAGLPADDTDVLDVGSPFDYEANALLYCATHVPDPRRAESAAAVVDELVALIEAAGGRTLALFTSWRAMDNAAAAVRDRVDMPLMTQREMPKPRLVEWLASSPETCLFATMSFWQGVDVPGEALSVVTIDRLPFPRPDEPLFQARRERAGAAAFELVDVPRAAMLLAQGAGRLIRTATDRGVVAVLDPRLATARYRWDIIRALPPMRRTKDRAEVERFLRQLRDA
jgi:ATP-dependent DNA helicase DinG